MPNFTGTISLSTGGMGKSFVAQAVDANGNPFAFTTLGTPPPESLATYGNGWEVLYGTPAIDAVNTLNLGNTAGALVVNSNTSTLNGIFTATWTLATSVGVGFVFRYVPSSGPNGGGNYAVVDVYWAGGANLYSQYYEVINGSMSEETYTADLIGSFPGTDVPISLTIEFNGTAITVSYQGTVTKTYSSGAAPVAGLCGLVGTYGPWTGNRYIGSFNLETTTGTSIFTDDFAYSGVASVPTFAINGGSAVATLPPVTLASSPYVLWPIPQYDPQYRWPLDGFCRVATGTASPLSTGYYLDQSLAVSGSGAAIVYYFQGLNAAEWNVAVTWTAASTNTTAAVYTVVSGSAEQYGANSDGNGATLATATINQTVAPSGTTSNGHVFQSIGTFTLSAVVNGITINVANGNSTGNLIFDAVTIFPVSAVSIVVKDTDVVTANALYGWASFPDTSYAPALTNAPVTNLVGGYNFPVVDLGATRTMALGCNVPGDNAYAMTPLMGNIANRIGIGPGLVQNLLEWDPVTFYPTKLGYNVIGMGMSGNIHMTASDGQNSAMLPFGTYTIEWDGPDDMALSGPGVSEVAADAVVTGKTNNKRVFNIVQTNPLQPCPNPLNLDLTSAGPQNSDGSWPASSTNFRVWLPGANQAPATLAEMASPSYVGTVFGTCVRMMNDTGVNGEQTQNFDQYLPANALPAGANNAMTSVIASIGPGTATGTFFPGGVIPLLFTCTEPHGYQTGILVQFNGTWPTITFTDGTSAPFSSPYSQAVQVVDATRFQMDFVGYTSKTASATVAATAGPTVSASCATGDITLQGQVVAANAANGGAGADLWFSVPMFLTDACVTSIVEYFAANLTPGVNLIVEYSNETWNEGFTQADVMNVMAAATFGYGTSYANYYVYRAAQVHATARAAWTSTAGPDGKLRTAATLVRTLGAQGGNTQTTQAICEYAQANSVAFDLLNINGYINNDYPVNIGTVAALQPTYDAMNADQTSELADLNIKNTTRFAPQHRAILEQYGYTNVKTCVYEGSVGDWLPNSNGETNGKANLSPKEYAVNFHPRAYQQTIYNLSLEEASGHVLYNNFLLSGYLGPGEMWASSQTYTPNPGTGSLTADATNLTNPTNFTTLKSETLGGYKAWAAVAPKFALAAPPSLLKFFFHEGTLHGGFSTLGI